MSPIGSLLLCTHVTLAAGTTWIGPPATDDGSAEITDAPSEGTEPDGSVTDPASGDSPDGSVEDPEGDPETPTPDEPDPTASDPLVHLDRAQTLVAAGDLTSAEAEVSVAISLAPNDATAYLERAQIRVALAEQAGGEDAAQRRAHAELLRLAATDVSAYLEHAALEPEGVAWFEARRDALLREADALDPPAPPEPKPVADEPEPTNAIAPPTDPDDDGRVHDPRRRSATLLSVGAITGATAVGLATASLRIERSCPPNEVCTASWRSHPALLAPALVLAGASSAAVVLALAEAPSLQRRHVRAGVIGSTIALGSAAVVFGTLTGAITASRWSTVSPANDAALGTIQTLGNTSVASFTAALPLLSAGVTTWIRGRLEDRARSTTAARSRAARPSLARRR